MSGSRSLGHVPGEIVCEWLELPSTEGLKQVLAAEVHGQVPAGGFREVAPTPESDGHDSYFHIGRAAGNPQTGLAVAAGAARQIFANNLKDSPTNLSDAELQSIDAGLRRIAGGRGGVVPSKFGAKPGAVSDPAQVLARWVGGHQVFMVFTQALIWAQGALARAGDGPGLEAALDEITALYDASALTFRFTGDLAPDAYNDVIRPSMLPPYTEVALSGLMSSDHNALVAMMRNMAGIYETAQSASPEAYGRMQAALGRVYDVHGLVCGRFVGAERSLMNSCPTCKPATEILQTFKRQRMKPLEPGFGPRSRRRAALSNA